MPAANQTHRRPSELRVALSCLSHPWSLVALALLAVNDHWWKGVGNGALTGKLSDVAGLFYFPFLVVAAIAWVARPRARTSDALPVGKVVFVGAGVWFAAAKTLPFVHTLTVDVATLLVGDVSVVRDPTDALAVIMLVPAWWLYRRVADSAPRTFARIVQVPVLCTAVVFTAATSRARDPGVSKLIVHDGKLHAVVTKHGRQVFSTTDGVTWTLVDTPADELVRKHKQRRELTLPTGQTLRLKRYSVWSNKRRLWGISRDRREFMHIAGAVEWGTADIATLPNDPRVVVIALGTEGVVIRDAANKWHRHGVGPAQPTASETSFFEATKMVVSTQWFAGLGGALMAWSLLSWLTWCRRGSALPHARAVATGHSASQRAKDYLLAPVRALTSVRFNAGLFGAAALGVLFAGLLLSVFLDASSYAGTGLPLRVLGTLFLSLWTAMAIGAGWQHHKRNAEQPSARSYDHIEESMLCGVATLVPLGLWDAGVIVSLDTAASASMATLALTIVFFAGRNFRKSGA